jgi:4-hydroxy-L-threonine phosphate dehydrogenase PdxA
MTPLVAFTCGDPAGIGPEVAVKAMKDARVRRALRPLAIGPRAAFERAGWRSSTAPLLDPGTPHRERPRGPSAEGGAASHRAVSLSVDLALRGLVDAIVTAPVSKESWALAGVGHLDHTQLIRERTGSKKIAMMLLGGGMRVALATRHIPHGAVPKRLSVSAIGEAAALAREGLRILGIRRPSLGLCALNPHAGDGGLLGSEETRVLAPAAKRLGLDGPHPADALWKAHRDGRFDALVAAYHDQALIPLKVAAGYAIVNWTLGSPVVRTSPGHGTASARGEGRPEEPMRTLAILALLAAALPVGAAEAELKLSAKEIVDRANKSLRGDSSHAKLTMTVVTPKWKRKLTIEGWNKGRKMAYIVIHKPAKEKGTTTLRRGGEMWMWMPRVERLLKVPPTMMHSSWQGSDFTYEDIVKADSIVKDYTHKLLKKVEGEPYDTYTFEATPKPDAPVVWGKVIFTTGVYPDGWVVALKEEDYNERGELIRTITLSDIKVMGGHRVPTKLVCEPRRRKGRKTILEYHKLEFNVPLEDSFFSLSRVQR